MNATQAIKEADRRGYHCDESGKVYNPKGKELSRFTYTRQYLAFSLRIGDKVFKIPVHRFVAFQLHGEVIFQDGVQVRHLDNVATNNSWHNIGFGTCHQNRMDIPKQTRINRARHAAIQRWQGVA